MREKNYMGSLLPARIVIPALKRVTYPHLDIDTLAFKVHVANRATPLSQPGRTRF